MTSQRVLLVTGGSGYLGRHLTAKAAEKFKLYTTYNSRPERIKAGQPFPLDVGDRESVVGFITDLAPRAIIHTAAVNPGGSEEAMLRVNVAGSRHVAEGAVTVGARLVHISTDVLHNGRHAPYDDEALPDPLNPYGRSKATAETVISEVAPKAIIVRTSLIYGLAEMDRGTAGFVRRLQAGQTLTLFNDVIRQPIWVETLSEALLRLVDLDRTGILNVAGRQALTREQFGRRMLKWWRIDTGQRVTAGRAALISDKIPLDLRLSITKAERLLDMTFPGVDEVLSQST